MTERRAPDLHFADPRLADLYDLTCPWSADTDFYLSLADRESMQILDLGCGTGLLANAYAGHGHAVVGVDPARAMLDVAARKSNGRLIDWVEAYAQDYTSERGFDLVVMSGHSFQTLIDDAEIDAVLAHTRRHLRGDGRFAFETRNPTIDWVRRWDRTSARYTAPGGAFDQRTLNVRRIEELIDFEHEFRLTTETLRTSSRLRLMPQGKIEAALRRAGFDRFELYGDWHRSPFDAEASLEMIFVAS